MTPGETPPPRSRRGSGRPREHRERHGGPPPHPALKRATASPRSRPRGNLRPYATSSRSCAAPASAVPEPKDQPRSSACSRTPRRSAPKNRAPRSVTASSCENRRSGARPRTEHLPHPVQMHHIQEDPPTPQARRRRQIADEATTPAHIHLARHVHPHPPPLTVRTGRRPPRPRPAPIRLAAAVRSHEERLTDLFTGRRHHGAPSPSPYAACSPDSAKPSSSASPTPPTNSTPPTPPAPWPPPPSSAPPDHRPTPPLVVMTAPCPL
ncbi:hypothetical protein SAMN05660976_00894 [Nonomuraea pusilla]|uniref:Uncharacterized protein n=1 Tax=Nonomuraea pusilla TaxID=46177 RepID=A0A1H7IRK8_9ACTN|nr:hypothetical protein SAMN05660976_00894 [Nonomuraea pusilla]